MDLEVLNQTRKRELHEQIPTQLCPLLSILCDGCFYTHLFYSANQQQAALVLFSVWKLKLRQVVPPEMAPWAFPKDEGSSVTSNWQRPNCQSITSQLQHHRHWGWAFFFFCGSCPTHYRPSSSILGLHPLGTNRIHPLSRDYQKMSPDVTVCLLGRKNHCSVVRSGHCPGLPLPQWVFGVWSVPRELLPRAGMGKSS